jgi:hypothetical protein
MLKHNKHSKYWHANKAQDASVYLGYEYHGNVYKNTISPELYYSNEKNTESINLLEKMINFLIDRVKQIKLQYSIAHDKNDIKLN